MISHSAEKFYVHLCYALLHTKFSVEQENAGYHGKCRIKDLKIFINRLRAANPSVSASRVLAQRQARTRIGQSRHGIFS